MRPTPERASIDGIGSDGLQLDVAALRLQLQRLRELLQLDVARAGDQAHRADHVGAGQLAQVHGDAAGNRLHVQFGIARAFELQRLGEVLEFQGARVRAVDRHLARDVLQFHVGAAALQFHLALDVAGADQLAAADLQPRIAADPREPDIAAVASPVPRRR